MGIAAAWLARALPAGRTARLRRLGRALGVLGTVQLLARALDDQHLQITLSDNGRGIDPADQRRIFEPFFTTQLGRGSSGLGLHVVHNIVTGVLGGQIEVQSSPGAGTTFLLKLPLVAPAASGDWASA